MRLVITILLIVSASLNAASHYIRSGATAGSNTGASWANAWTNFDSVTWARGDTYYLAGGSYVEDVTIGPAVSGSTWVVLKKANAADNSGDAGWDSAYATTQASVLGQLYLTTGYIEVDGVTGSGTSGHGIKVYLTSTHSGFNTVVLMGGSSEGPFHLYHLEILGQGYDFGSVGGHGVYWNNIGSLSAKGLHLNVLWVHEIPQNGVTLGNTVGTSYSDYGMLVEDSVFERTGGCGMRYPTVHGQTFQLSFGGNTSQYVIWRKNIFRNCSGQAFISFLGTGSTNHYVRAYNNVFYSETPDITAYALADSGTTTSFTQASKDFTLYETLIGRTITNVTQSAAGVVTARTTTTITMAAGMTGGITNAAGDEFAIPIDGRSGHKLATSIYTTSANDVQNVELVNNTFFNLHKAQISITSPINASGNVCQNNLWMSNYFTTDAFMPNITAHGYWANLDGTYAPEDTEASDPFVASASYNFHLLSSANAVGTATNRSDIFTTDAAGNTRAVPWDIGAYAYTTNEPLSLSVGTLNVGTITGP